MRMKIKKSKNALTIQNIANEANVSRQYIYGNEKLMERIADRNGLHTLETAEKIGVGSRKYKLVNLDSEQ